jgi:hypothetical protein
MSGLNFQILIEFSWVTVPAKMLRITPTRIELKQDDMAEYEKASKVWAKTAKTDDSTRADKDKDMGVGIQRGGDRSKQEKLAERRRRIGLTGGVA